MTAPKLRWQNAVYGPTDRPTSMESSPRNRPLCPMTRDRRRPGGSLSALDAVPAIANGDGSIS